MKFPVRYIPRNLSNRDKQIQKKMLLTSKKMYRQKQYYTRKKIKSFHSKPSGHVSRARRIYGVDKIRPNKELSRKTGCSISALRQIVKKGEGAYFSSGSRPNQTPQSWGFARLASSITAGKAAAVDFDILSRGCNHKKRAFRLATQSRRKYGYGQSRTQRVVV